MPRERHSFTPLEKSLALWGKNMMARVGFKASSEFSNGVYLFLSEKNLKVFKNLPFPS
jgi:hypothetical protein